MVGQLSEHEMRRAPRIPADVWVMVQGVDDELVLRRGNISASGIIFGADDLHLDVGSLEYLHVTSADRKVGLVVMAQVARKVVLEGGPVGHPQQAVAFEFMPENPMRRRLLQSLVTHIATADAAPQLDVPAQGQVFALEIPSLQFTATWPIAAGDRVQVVVRQGNGRIPFEGIVRSVVASPPGEGPPRYEVETSAMRAGQRPVTTADLSLTESIDIAMADLMSNGITGDLSAERPHLKGRLERIGLSTVLSWFDVGRVSGRLRVQGPKDVRATLFLREGSIVDVDGTTQDDPIEGLREVLSWAKGRFELHEGEVLRPDRVQTPTTAILLELARQADESNGVLSFVA